MKFFVITALLGFLGLQVSCSSDSEKRQEAQEKIDEAHRSGEDVEVDRDIIGDDEVEID